MQAALGDGDGRVRAAALRVAESLGEAAAAEIRPHRFARVDDPDPAVRLQLMLSLQRDDPEAAWPVLLKLLEQGGPEELALAAAASLASREVEFIAALPVVAGEPGRPVALAGLLEQLGYMVLARGDPAEIGRLLEILHRRPDSSTGLSSVWRGAAAHKSNRALVQLAKQPPLAAAQAPDRELAEALLAQVTWPGDTRQAGPEIVPLTPAEEKLFALGKEQYALVCAACHQPNGRGLTGVAPSLVGSEWVVGPARLPVEIILRGLAGPIEVQGEKWDMVMPGLGSLFDDEKVAGLATYIRRAWGNQASAVHPEQAAAIRQQGAARTVPWTGPELRSAVATEAPRR